MNWEIWTSEKPKLIIESEKLDNKVASLTEEFKKIKSQIWKESQEKNIKPDWSKANDFNNNVLKVAEKETYDFYKKNRNEIVDLKFNEMMRNGWKLQKLNPQCSCLVWEKWNEETEKIDTWMNNRNHSCGINFKKYN